MDLTNAVVYDEETFPNVFTCTMEMLYSDSVVTFEISEYRDDRAALWETLQRFRAHQIPMIGFNSLGFDYPLLHLFYNRPDVTHVQLYAKAQMIMNSNDAFGHMIWDSDRICPQIDLYKVHHFDNIAKRCSLKSLQIQMRSPFVCNSPVPFNTPLTREQIDKDLIPYNVNDVRETKRFAFYSLPALNFRIGMIGQFGRHPLEILNYNDTKIGEKMLEQRLGDQVCYAWHEYDVGFNGEKRRERVRRQTHRSRIELAQIIFPYIRFHTPEFQRVLEFMRAQVLTPDDLDDPEATVKTKGVFKGLVANVGGLHFVFGTGGMHASVEGKRYAATDQIIIRDLDVSALYPSISIVNNLAPEHLGGAFVAEYAKIPVERKQHAKGTYQNAALKLAANGTWGKSNNQWSVFYDPKYAMTIPINGQLMICMLAEWLLTVPTLQLIQCNTDGITYLIDRAYEPQAAEIAKQWEAYTCLTLEFADYKRMWIRDVNNYVAEDIKGKLKQKGAYWYPDPKNYADSISQASPPCWYKDLGNIVSIQAAVAHMVHSVDIESFISSHTDPYDFMLRAKADKGSYLMIGDRPTQSTIRYYISRAGAPLVKISPPPAGHEVGQWKRAQKITKAEYDKVMAETGGAWDPRVCTKNQSRYDNRPTSIEAGWKVVECNDARAFDFADVNYEYYIAEARKLVV